MTTVTMKRLACGAAILGALGFARAIPAQIGVGTWVKQVETPGATAMTMIVEPCCNGGRRLTYHVGDKTLMVVESPFDGSDAPLMIGGKPSGETMGIKRLDDHHTFSTLKMNGQLMGTAKGTLSPDGKTLTVEGDYRTTAGGQMVGKQTEIWVRK